MENNQSKKSDKLSPLMVGAFALGTAIGWGSLVVTTNTYLRSAGPMGSIFGLLIGAAIMLLISRNYHFLMNHFSGSGGIFTYATEILGADFGFIATWFMALIYIAMFWANATSLPLFAKYLFGDILCFGFHYSIFGYEVYLNEAALVIAAILLTGYLCTHFRQLSGKINTVLVVYLSLAITFCFAVAAFKHESTFSFAPSFVPDKSSAEQILRIAIISPWAFIGFENVSHAVGDFGFSAKKSFSILRAVVLVATALYIFVILLSISAYPASYSSWIEYIKDLPNLSGIEALPPFFASRHYLGNTGVAILFVALFALIMSSFFGNVLVLGRIISTAAANGILSKKFAETQNGNPNKAIWLVIRISCVIPFLGRTAIGWIVDITTINATIVYGFVSFCAWKLAKKEKSLCDQTTGMAGFVLMIIFAFFLILPNFFRESSIARESYFLFILWAILGFVAFHAVLSRDTENRFGHSSTAVWVSLSALILVMSLIWLNELNKAAIADALEDISEYLSGSVLAAKKIREIGEAEYMKQAMNNIHTSNIQSSLVVILLFAIQLLVMASNQLIVAKHEAASKKANTAANTDPLTGVKSKHAFVEYENKVNARLSAGEKIEFAVVVCDVNGLKQINDTQGHKAGDAYIQAACRLICTLFKHSPVFRIGGDEFVVVMSGSDFENRSNIMKEMNLQVEKNRDEKRGVVIAAGISDFKDGSDLSILTVFERADALMYERKKELKGLR